MKTYFAETDQRCVFGLKNACNLIAELIFCKNNFVNKENLYNSMETTIQKL